ncbi:UvrD-helicase domain-containing protein [Alkalihalobacillus deserti]|uniref:UvrD-helicase domain-containing protein n=1 Tax=Alkalihalobacillus deserti TaxID=2879466 RepID=UPI001D14CB8E|nr:UvrD-helicase domain-containing protein [Alkalihalobacillus deserti]
MKFNDEQLEAITSEKSLVLVSAGAGSGKTRVLTERFIHLCELRLRDKSHPVGATADEIVAITFTEKAAREMKDRIRKRLAEKEKEATGEKDRFFWSEQKEAIERAHISTFHSFCQRLLSQNAMTADLIPNSRVIDDVDARSRKRAIMTKMLEEKDFQELALPLLQIMSKNQLFESIEKVHDDIREFVVGEKTIDTLQLDEMLDKQCEEKIKVQNKIVQQFHENAKRCVREFPPLDELTKAQRNHVERITEAFQTLTIPENPNAYVEFLKQIMPSKSDKRWNETAPALYEMFEVYWKPLKELWKEIGGEVVVDKESRQYLQHVVTLLKEFSNRYVNEKKISGVLDFSDLQQKAVALLEHPFIKVACQKQFRHMMVDEFQDTNRLQLEMLERIEPAFQFIVGDQKQSIYRFRGANVSLMNEREELAITRRDAQVILMNKNYRTTAPVIEAVNELFSHAMVSQRSESFETVYASLEAHRSGERQNEKRVELTILEKDEERKTNSYDVLANRIVEMIQTGEPHVYKDDTWVKPSFCDVAILIPARSHLLTLERALINKGIPYVVSGGVGFYERQEVLDYLSLLRWLNRPFEELHLLAVLRSPICGLSFADFLTLKSSLQETESLYQLVYNRENPEFSKLSFPVQEACHIVQTWLERWTPFRTQKSLEQTLEAIFMETGLRTSLLLQKNGLQKVRNVEKLIETITESHHTDLETILTDLEERIALSEKEGESLVERVDDDVIQIMTVHASKGLEFPIVCLPQLERQIRGDKGIIRFHPEVGLVLNMEEEASELDGDPIVYQTPGFALVKDRANAESQEEAKRLYYVAMTRARDFLYMIGEESKTKNTWLALTEDALNQTHLHDKIEIKEESEEQEQVQLSSTKYDLPQQIEKKGIPLTLSVSEVMLFMKDPVAYFNRYVIGLPDTSLGNDTKSLGFKTAVDPSKLGTLVHRACELRDNGLTSENAIAEALHEEELEDLTPYQTEMKKLMTSYTDEIKQDMGETITNEWAFATNIEGADIIGEIDKIVVKNGQIHLVDFKTNRIRHSGEELMSTYWSQLYLYKIAYEQETGEVVSDMSLFVFRDKENPLHTLDHKQEEEAAVREAIRTICTLRTEQASKVDYKKLALYE